MPKVMMISGVKTLGSGDVGRSGVPVAGAYRPPIGRLVGQTNLGGAPSLSAQSIRSGLMAPLLRGAGVGDMQMIPQYARPEFIPGAVRLPSLGVAPVIASRGRRAVVTPTDIANRSRRGYTRRVPTRARPEFIPGAVRLPSMRGVGFIPGQGQLPQLRGLGFIPGQGQLPQLRGGLGDIDMCTDPGWVFAQNALATAGAAMTAAAGTGDERDDGWAAAGGVTTGATSAWQTTCTAEAQRRAQAAAAAGDPTELDYIRRELELERLRREADGDAYMRFASTNQPPPAPTGVPEWVWYAGAAVGVGALAYVLLGKKRRRR